jgi:hypothetical protein
MSCQLRAFRVLQGQGIISTMIFLEFPYNRSYCGKYVCFVWFRHILLSNIYNRI